MKMDYSKRIFGLDIMRATAIMMVVVSHALWLGTESEGIVYDLLRLSGVMGVEIFFVLSGFLIGRIILKMLVENNFSFNQIKYFWVRRWFRTLPNYYLVLILNILLALVLGDQLPRQLWKYVFFIQNFSTPIPLFFTESWSLPIEENAYIIGPLLLYLVLSINFKVKKTTLFLWTTLFIISVFTVNKLLYNLNNQETTMSLWNASLKAVTIYRIDAIFYGFVAAYVSFKKPKLWLNSKVLCVIIGLLIILAVNYSIPKLNLFIENSPFFWNVFYLPINSIAIALCLPFLSSIESAPKFFLVPITFISIISYSMYLLHYSIILRLVKDFITLDSSTEYISFIMVSIYIISTIVMAYLLYRIFEKPMMDLRDKPAVVNRFK